MKIPRTERIARIMWRLTKNPFRSFSLSDIAKGFKVSKTVISDDIEIISVSYTHLDVYKRQHTGLRRISGEIRKNVNLVK